MDKSIIKRIILENRQFIENVVVKNRAYNFEDKGNYVLTGIRRAGKSFLLFHEIKKAIQNNPEDNIIYINFEDERLLEITSSDLDLILESAYELNRQKPLLFFDEIQNVGSWEKFARRLADTDYRVFITGSNAKMLSKEISTTLGGRYLVKEIFPLTFSEYLNYHNIIITNTYEFSSLRFEVRKRFNHFFRYGGFPELSKYENPKEYLSNIFMKVFYGDLVARNHIQNEHVLKLLIKKIAESVNNETSLNRLKNIIQSVGYKIGSNTIAEYTNYLNDAYLIFQISNYSATFTERETKKKYYFIDQGILNLFINDQDTKLLENIVFIELLRRYGNEIYYFKRKYEVDFYLPNKKYLVQVTYSLSDIETERREVKALQYAMKELQINESLIITFDEYKEIKIGDIAVKAVPVWTWLLNK